MFSYLLSESPDLLHLKSLIELKSTGDFFLRGICTRIYLTLAIML